MHCGQKGLLSGREFAERIRNSPDESEHMPTLNSQSEVWMTQLRLPASATNIHTHITVLCIIHIRSAMENISDYRNPLLHCVIIVYIYIQ